MIKVVLLIIAGFGLGTIFGFMIAALATASRWSDENED